MSERPTKLPPMPRPNRGARPLAGKGKDTTRLRLPASIQRTLAIGCVVAALVAGIGVYAYRDALLVRCARTGNLVGTEVVLWLGASVNAVDDDGNFPLLLGVERGYTKLPASLLKHGADPKMVDREGKPLVFRAVEKGNMVILQRLLLWRFDPNQAGPEGLTPVGLAVREGKYDLAKALCKAGADIDKADGSGKPPIFQAIEGNDIPKIQKLLELGASINAPGPGGSSALVFALDKHRPMAMHLLEHRLVDPNVASGDGTTALHVAAKQGDARLIGRLIKLGAKLDPAGKDGTPLTIAISEGQLAAVDALLLGGCDASPLENQLRDAARVLSTWSRDEGLLDGNDVATHLDAISAPAMQHYLRIFGSREAKPLGHAAEALSGYGAAYDAYTSARDGLAEAERGYESNQQRFDELRQANPIRSVIILRRFDTNADGRGMYEAFDVGIQQKLVIVANEGVVSPGYSSVPLPLSYLGEKPVVVTNSTVFRSFDRQEYYKHYEISKELAELSQDIKGADARIAGLKEARDRAAVEFGKFSAGFARINRALKKWRS